MPALGHEEVATDKKNVLTSIYFVECSKNPLIKSPSEVDIHQHCHTKCCHNCKYQATQSDTVPHQQTQAGFTKTQFVMQKHMHLLVADYEYMTYAPKLRTNASQ